MIINQRDITTYIAKNSGGYQPTSELMQAILLGPIKRDPRFFVTATINDLSSKTLRQKFKRASNVWRRFNPTKELDEIIARAQPWVHEFVRCLGPDYNGIIRLAALNRAKSINSISCLERSLNQPYLPQDFVNALWDMRLIPEEEKKKHVQFESSLRGRHYLVRLKSLRGAQNEGKNAQNCLGYNKLPENREPHKYRVLRPEEWLYFSVRNPDNRSIMTIAVDVKKGFIVAEGTKNMPVSKDQQHLMTEATAYILTAYPSASKNYIAEEGCNTPRFQYIP